MTRIILLSVLAFFAMVPAASADAFKSADQCKPGARVMDSQNKAGVVTQREANGGVLCTVKLNGGKETTYIFWMLHAAGGSAETDDKLVPGTYQCYANGNYTFMDMQILNANTYASAGARGRFHVEPSRKIVFETGPLSKNFAHLLAGPSIGLNTNGGTFYATTCGLKKK